MRRQSDKMAPKRLFFVLLVILLSFFEQGAALFCHRCYSAMGGCLHDLDLWMYPWKSCGDSDFCVKYIEKTGSGYRIIRECESVLQKQTRHRMQMPVLRRHGYCLPSRKHDPRNPSETTDSSIMYCFCNDFDGCNAGGRVRYGAWSLVGVALVLLIARCI